MIKELLTPSLQQDEKVKALTEALDLELEKIENEIINVLILPRVDEIQDEELLDLLAWQFHIEGYELAQSVEEKRNLIKKAIELHRYKGTPYAIRKVLEALGLDGRVREWFEYSGQPYKFKVDIDLVYRSIDEDTLTRLLELIEEYKNVRSHLDALNVYLTARFKNYRAIATISGCDLTLYPYTVRDITLEAGQYRAIAYQSVHTTTIYPGR